MAQSFDQAVQDNTALFLDDLRDGTRDVEGLQGVIARVERDKSPSEIATHVNYHAIKAALAQFNGNQAA